MPVLYHPTIILYIKGARKNLFVTPMRGIHLGTQVQF